MQILTPHFGSLEIDESTVITFPDGMPGFEACKRFKLLHEEVPEPRVLWLQSLDVSELVFSVIDASSLDLHYQLTLNDEERSKLEHDRDEDIVLLLTLVKDGRSGRVSPNTRSPIILNTVSRKAIQKSGMRAEIVLIDE